MATFVQPNFNREFPPLPGTLTRSSATSASVTSPERVVAAPERLDEPRTIGASIELEVLPASYEPTISAGEALDIADRDMAHETPTRVTRTLVSYTDGTKKVPAGAPPNSKRELVHVDIPVWLITYEGVCVPMMGPVERERTPGECAGTEINAVVNADTGRDLGWFSYR